MSRSSARRAQVEPFAALAAVFVLGVALTAYAGVLADTSPERNRHLARPTLERAVATVSVGAVAVPARLSRLDAPHGYRLNATLTVAGRQWSVGPSSPRNADVAREPVPVRVASGDVRAGALRVEVWR